jgi:DNA-binding transcriptional LysR family regulator
MDTYEHLKTFVRVARDGSFTSAARGLGVVPSVVAKRVAQLEASLNTRLFERSTRSVRLTESGEALQARAAQLIASLDELLASVGQDESRLQGRLRVMAPTSLTMARLGPMFCEFLREHPGITMDLVLVDASVNPAEGGFDVAISGRTASYEGVLDIPICPVQPVLCAAPSYLQAKGFPKHPRDLVDHECLVFKPSGASWQFQSARGAVTVDPRARLVADDNHTLREAAVLGLGIAALPAYVVLDDINRGKLVQILLNFPLQENWFKAYLPKRKKDVARIVALIAWLSHRLGSQSIVLQPTTVTA